MASNPIPKVNDKNEVIGETTISEAFENNWSRRVTRIFISNEKGEFLLQKRSLESKIHPGVWDCSGGHVDIGESYAEAGVREVFEELGVNLEVKEVSAPVFFDTTFYVVCRAQLDSSTELTLKIDEVTEVKWVSTDEYFQMVALHPSNFTPWVVHIWKTMKDALCGRL